MSDSIVAILGVGFLAGVTLTLIMLGVSYAMDNNKRQRRDDTDMRIYVPSRDRDRSGNKRGDKQMERMTSESLAAILRTMRTTLKIDDEENAYLLEAADRLERLDRVEKWVQKQE
jgi:hypothetical protein